MDASDLELQIETLRANIGRLRELVASIGGGEPLAGDALPQLRMALDALQAHDDGLQTALETARLECIRYRELFDEAPDAFIVTDQHGMVLEANKAAGHLLNTSSQFLTGHPIADFISQKERPSFRSDLNRGALAEQTQEWDVQMLPRNAAPFSAALVMTPVTGGTGAVHALRWHIRDVTERTVLACLWRLRTRTRELRAVVLKTSAGLELRIVQPDGVVISSELLSQWPSLLARSDELRQTLEAKGWEKLS